MRLSLLSVSTLLIATTLTSAQPPAASTGQKGQLLPGSWTRVYAVNGERAQHIHCFVTQHGLNPVVAIISLQPPANPQDPLAVLLQKLNALSAANKDAKFGAYAIFLTLEKDFYEDSNRTAKVGPIEGLVTQLKLTDVSLGLTYPDSPPVKQYGIDVKGDPVNNLKKHEITVLVYNKMRVQERFVFTEDKKLDDQAIKDIFAAAEKMLPAK